VECPPFAVLLLLRRRTHGVFHSINLFHNPYHDHIVIDAQTYIGVLSFSLQLDRFNLSLCSWTDSKSLQHMDPCVTCYGQIHWKTLAMKKLQNILLIIVLEVVHISIGKSGVVSFIHCDVVQSSKCIIYLTILYFTAYHDHYDVAVHRL
jgi:hypothetical protein